MTETSVDLRPMLLPVRDQGHRGTCLAFAVTALHEVLRAAGEPVGEDLAEEALYWGCKQVDGNWNTGTSFLSASMALPRWGQPIEATWPYDPRQSDGVAYHPPAIPGGANWHHAGLRSVTTTSTDVRSLLAGSVPVALGITIYPSFYRPNGTGHIADPQPGDPKKGRHAVVAVGFDEDEILIRNSWGPTWGVSGYGWITDTYIDGNATEVWAADVSPTTATTTSATTTTESEGLTYGTA
jgi:C1A family cysteine protease